jgi:hypothetical protein
MTTLDLDSLISKVQAHSPNDVICKKAVLLELAERLRAAEKDAERFAYWFSQDVRDCKSLDQWRVFVDQQRKIATGEDIGL